MFLSNSVLKGFPQKETQNVLLFQECAQSEISARGARRNTSKYVCKLKCSFLKKLQTNAATLACHLCIHSYVWCLFLIYCPLWVMTMFHIFISQNSCKYVFSKWSFVFWFSDYIQIIWDLYSFGIYIYICYHIYFLLYSKHFDLLLDKFIDNL